MEVRCTRCGRVFEGKSRRGKYCEGCRKRTAVERSVEKSGSEGNAALAAERLRLGLTVKEMAAYLGVDQTAYYRAEHHGMEPGIGLRRAVEDKLGVSAEELFGELSYIRTCWTCGNVFRTQNAKKRTCPDCERTRHPEYTPCGRRHPTASVQEIAAAARAAGMSYGQYVSNKEGRHE